MTDLIYSATKWPTNAAMIADVHRLGYLKDTDVILDPTYGRGGWWRVWRPNLLYYVNRQEAPWWDFRDMRLWYDTERRLPDKTFDAVAFDPPYISVGGRASSGIKQMHDAYGMNDTPTSPAGVQADIDAGLAECFRVVKRGGIVLVKTQSYVSSGKLFPGLFNTYNAAMALGFRLEDHFNFLGGARPQDEDRGPQKHSRRNQSDLLVLRRPKRSGRK